MIITIDAHVAFEHSIANTIDWSYWKSDDDDENEPDYQLILLIINVIMELNLYLLSARKVLFSWFDKKFNTIFTRCNARNRTGMSKNCQNFSAKKQTLKVLELISDFSWEIHSPIEKSSDTLADSLQFY